jgi:hypothetical protein
MTKIKIQIPNIKRNKDGTPLFGLIPIPDAVVNSRTEDEFKVIKDTLDKAGWMPGNMNQSSGISS